MIGIIVSGVVAVGGFLVATVVIVLLRVVAEAVTSSNSIVEFCRELKSELIHEFTTTVVG